MFIGLTGCKITKKSANRTYAIYGFIYPFYGFLHIPLWPLNYRNVVVIRARTIITCRNIHTQRSHVNPLNIHIGQDTGSPAAFLCRAAATLVGRFRDKADFHAIDVVGRYVLGLILAILA